MFILESVIRQSKFESKKLTAALVSEAYIEILNLNEEINQTSLSADLLEFLTESNETKEEKKKGFLARLWELLKKFWQGVLNFCKKLIGWIFGIFKSNKEKKKEADGKDVSAKDVEDAAKEHNIVLKGLVPASHYKEILKDLERLLKDAKKINGYKKFHKDKVKEFLEDIEESVSSIKKEWKDNVEKSSDIEDWATEKLADEYENLSGDIEQTAEELQDIMKDFAESAEEIHKEKTEDEDGKKTSDSITYSEFAKYCKSVADKILPITRAVVVAATNAATRATAAYERAAAIAERKAEKEANKKSKEENKTS